MTQYTAKFPDTKGVIDWSEQENNTWQFLLERQNEIINDRACPEFINRLQQIGFELHHVPQIKQVNQALLKTKWQMIPVTGTIQVQEFFKMLSRREFPVANFIRVPEELDYLRQPDVFHEFYGHGPMLLEPVYADFMQWYGQQAQKFPAHAQRIFSRLFWYTIEFGLVNTNDGTRIYGGGILSSFEETQYCLESNEPNRIRFELNQVLQSDYNYQEIQKQYFVLDDLTQIFELQDNKMLDEIVLSHSQGDTKPFINC
jgi:phenylalanine-4-hydroxylase